MLLLLHSALAAPELCNGSDDDGNGLVDEAPVVWFADGDGDGRGDPRTSVITATCSAPAGFVADASDCDDGDPAVYGGAAESCDGRDNDCDGQIDENGCAGCTRLVNGDSTYQRCTSQVAWSVARDTCTGMGQHLVKFDSYAELSWVQQSLTDVPGPGWWCGLNDVGTNNWVYHDGSPGYVLWNAFNNQPNNLADDCGEVGYQPYLPSDGLFDVPCNDPRPYVCEIECTPRTWYADGDGDGFGTTVAVSACSAPAGHVAISGDCADSDAGRHPSADETCNGVDDDCDGELDEAGGGSWYADLDGDGFGNTGSVTVACSQPAQTSATPGDCDDTRPSVNPSGAEICNGLDDDCDGPIDEAPAGSTWYADSDGDGFGDPAVTTDACAAPAGFVADATDCGPASSTVFPGAPESCNGVDDDCDGLTDEGVGTTYFTDADGDGFGDGASTVVACSLPVGASSSGTDCNDASPSIYPGAPEVCDGIDQSCEGTVDEGLATQAWHPDGDGDGYGNPSISVTACGPPAGHLADATDCDDSDSAVSPAGSEVCDGQDNNCDGAIDEGVVPTWYADVDGDGFGDAAASQASCSAPSGFVGDATDCDDSEPLVSPSGIELCDLVDNDCDTLVDEAAVDASTFYTDADGDGFGDAATAVIACAGLSGQVVDGEDCDDSSASVHPGAPEVCGGVDDDCDGLVDSADPDLDASTQVSWYVDADGDGYGTGSGTLSCEAIPGHATEDGDCEDGVASINPGADEICDSIDNDCDALLDDADPDVVGASWYVDLDGDGIGAGAPTLSCLPVTGQVAFGGDCDDTDPATWPMAPEPCDGVDRNCDGVITGTPRFADGDGDGYGDPTTSETDCMAAGVLDGTDCDDADATIHPAAEELCDAADRDCDGDSVLGAIDAPVWFVDADGDGAGVEPPVPACEAPSGFASAAGDCDDTDPSVQEVCPTDGTGETGDTGSDPIPWRAPTAGCRCDQSGGSTGWMLGIGALLWARRAT